jgi:hypothetical protein
MPLVLADLNVVMDVSQRREPFFAASAAMLAGAKSGRLRALLAARSFTTLFYSIDRSRSGEHARLAVTRLPRLVAVAPVDGSTIDRALHLSYADFEGAVQMSAAVSAGADYLVTRDARSYRSQPVPVVTPAELLHLL